ncbi:MAG: ferritin-like domain-containing protein [Dehalococcoidia bacterium]|nr:ferritin-like domain-containing protein [Dehalococcoidia bacterium]
MSAAPTTPELDLSWLDLYDDPTSAEPTKKGLTLDAIDIGDYASAEDLPRDMTPRLRGAASRENAHRMGLTYQTKHDVWADQCRSLYEEAIQRQWSSARDIPWDTLAELPDEKERAICQVATMLTEVEFIAGDVPGQWLPRISGDEFEVGLFLMTQIMDEARHTDVFRKRALANGGGLLQQGAGLGLRNLIEAQDFTEMSVLMHVQAEGFVQSMFRMGELIGPTQADKRIFRMAAQDESRHLAFGVMHLKHILSETPERREEIHHYLDKAEERSAGGGSGDVTFPPVFESLCILLGGGKDRFDEGVAKFLLLRRRQVKEYLHRLEVAGLGDRSERLGPALAQYAN